MSACAADVELLHKPAVSVGASWRLRASDLLTKTVLQELTYTVQAVDDREIAISDSAGRTTLLDAATLAVKRANDVDHAPSELRVRYPLTLGARWETRYAFAHESCGLTQVRQQVKVVGWESITLPAGRFDAMRIESEGSWSNGCGADRLVHRHWVADGIAVPLRSEEIIYARGRLYSSDLSELVSLSSP